MRKQRTCGWGGGDHRADQRGEGSRCIASSCPHALVTGRAASSTSAFLRSGIFFFFFFPSHLSLSLVTVSAAHRDPWLTLLGPCSWSPRLGRPTTFRRFLPFSLFSVILFSFPFPPSLSGAWHDTQMAVPSGSVQCTLCLVGCNLLPTPFF